MTSHATPRHNATQCRTDSDSPWMLRQATAPQHLSAVQVECVFSDKTGTLTCNVMKFYKFSAAGVSYGQGTEEIGRMSGNQPANAEEVVCVCVCVRGGGACGRMPESVAGGELMTLCRWTSTNAEKGTRAVPRHLVLPTAGGNKRQLTANRRHLMALHYTE